MKVLNKKIITVTRRRPVPEGKKNRPQGTTTYRREIGVKKIHEGMEPTSEKIGVAIRKTRLSQQMSYGDVSARTGMPPATISKIETGKTKNPGLFTIMKLCELYNITLAQILAAAIKLPDAK